MENDYREWGEPEYMDDAGNSLWIDGEGNLFNGGGYIVAHYTPQGYQLIPEEYW